jgi:hypothetical protein
MCAQHALIALLNQLAAMRLVFFNVEGAFVVTLENIDLSKLTPSPQKFLPGHIHVIVDHVMELPGFYF